VPLVQGRTAQPRNRAEKPLLSQRSFLADRLLFLTLNPLGRQLNFLICAIGATLLLCSSEISSAARLDRQFENLLNGTAFVRYIKVAIPGDMYSINGKDGVGWVYYDGCFQGDTFWIRNCTNSIPGSGPMRPGCTVGVSSNENWYVRADGYTAISPITATSEEPPDKLVSNALVMMRSVYGLGMLKIGSLHVEEDNSFKAMTTDGHSLVGRFDVSEDGRPRRCEFTSSAYPKNPFLVAYSYSDGEGSLNVPSTIVQTVSISAFQTLHRTFHILDCQFGENVIPKGGYTANRGSPALIMPLYRNPIVFSNFGMYQKQPNGTIATLIQPSLFKAHKLIGWLLFIPMNVVLLFWLIVRARKQAARTHSGHNK
jgi:hypothetical protein